MSEVIPSKLNELITQNTTRQEFIERYKQLASNTDKSSDASIFDENADDAKISRIFDLIVNASNDTEFDSQTPDNIKISEADVKKIAGYDGDDSSISNEDLIKYYEEKLTTSNISNSIDSSQQNSYITTAMALDLYSDLKQLKETEAESKKIKLRDEINELIQNDEKISQELKDNAKKLKDDIDKINKELQAKKQEKEELERNKNIALTNLAKKEAQLKDTQDENQKETLQGEIDKLNSDIDGYTSKIDTLSKELSNLTKSLAKAQTKFDKLVAKIAKGSPETAEKISKKQDEIKEIDRKLEEDIADIDEQSVTMEQRIQAEARQTGQETAYYNNVAGGYINDGHVGKNAAQALSNAIGEIGVREATGHNDGAAVAKYRGGVDNGAAWCASFVSWCYKGNDVFGYQASVSGIMSKAQQKGLYSARDVYTPKPGDVMIQKSNGASHTGIVESVDPDGTIHTIEGNSSNQVRRVTYRKGSKGYNQISGWVRMSDSQNS